MTPEPEKPLDSTQTMAMARKEAFKWLCEQSGPIGVSEFPRLLAAYAKHCVEQQADEVKKLEALKAELATYRVFGLDLTELQRKLHQAERVEQAEREREGV
jgi:hypothetical protein